MVGIFHLQTEAAEPGLVCYIATAVAMLSSRKLLYFGSFCHQKDDVRPGGRKSNAK